VIFPEYFLTGPLEDPQHHHLADSTITRSWLDELRQAALRHRIAIVAGTIVTRAADSNELHNVCAYIGPDGKVAKSYTKQNLWHPEKSYLARGEGAHAAFDTPHGRVGLLVCWDLAWPEAFRALLLDGAELVIVPAYWLASDPGPVGLAHSPDAEKTFLDNVIVARAFENECAIAFANCAGSAKDGFVGRSAVAVPFKGCIARATDSEEEMLIVDLDLDILKDARAVYRIREDLLERVQRSQDGTVTGETL